MASSGGSSHRGAGKPSLIGGMMACPVSFLKQYFSSIRSVTHGGTGIGVKGPIVKGLKVKLGKQPLKPSGASMAATSSTDVLAFRIRVSLPAECFTTSPPGRIMSVALNRVAYRSE